MNTAQGLKPARALGAIMILAIVMLVMRTQAASHDPIAALAASGNDDIMRFLSVRDWLAGQDWFDMRQTGVVADGGLLLHWSRLVDAGIAGIIVPFSLVLPMAQAEAVGLLLWPLFLYIAIIYVTARGAVYHFGARAAVGAVLCLLLWPPYNLYFAPGRLDHHNVQILLLTGVILALLKTGSGWRSGAVAGLATGLSLAIGLETLLALGLTGLVLSLRAIWRPDRFAPALLGYGIALGSGALVFFAAQTHPSQWAAQHCDQLALPLLVPLLAICGVAAVLAALSMRVSQFSHRFAALVVFYGGAILVTSPLLMGCTEGPYGALPPAVEEAIYAQINEAKPLLTLIAEMPRTLHLFIIPLLVVLLASTGMWLFDRDAARREASGILLIFAWFATIAMLYQFRFVVLCAAVLPMLTSYVLGWSRSEQADVRQRKRAHLAASLIALTSIFYPFLWHKASAMQSEAGAPGQVATAQAAVMRQCRTHATLKPLQNLPEGVVFSSINLSPPVLLTTGLPILVAPYHRSAGALANGFLPFEEDEDGFRAAMHAMGADYIVLCRGERPHGFAGSLSQAVEVEGMRIVPQTNDVLVVYEMLK